MKKRLILLASAALLPLSLADTVKITAGSGPGSTSATVPVGNGAAADGSGPTGGGDASTGGTGDPAGTGSTDSDGDGLPDDWEQANGTRPDKSDAEEDEDEDGLTNAQEYAIGTYPNNRDSDADGTDDAEDGWAMDEGLKPPRLPEVRYVVIDLSQLGFPANDYPARVNDKGMVAGYTGVWKKEGFTPKPSSGNSLAGFDEMGYYYGQKLMGSEDAPARWKSGEADFSLLSLPGSYDVYYLSGVSDDGRYAVGTGAKSFANPDGTWSNTLKFLNILWHSEETGGGLVSGTLYGPVDLIEVTGGESGNWWANVVNNRGFAAGRGLLGAIEFPAPAYAKATGGGLERLPCPPGIHFSGPNDSSYEDDSVAVCDINNWEYPVLAGNFDDNGPSHPTKKFGGLWVKPEGEGWILKLLSAYPGGEGFVTALNDRLEIIGGLESAGVWSPKIWINGLAQNPADFLSGWQVSWFSDINNHGAIVGTAKKLSPGTQTPTGNDLPVMLVPCDIVPDLNRDGKIDNLDQGKITKDRPWRWWLNDDADSGDIGDGNTDQPLTETAYRNFFNQQVDGRCDLLDFAPLWLDIKQLVDVLPPGTFTYKFKQEDEGINVVFTDLVKADAGKYLKQDYTTSFGSALTSPPQSANTVKVTAAGVQIPVAFLNKIKDDANKGVILVEGAAKTTKPLVLEIYKGGDKVADFSFNISIDEVAKMFRWVNLRGVAGQGQTRGTDTAEPPNYPDKETNGKMFIFVHGYNVSEAQARGWIAEVFKRTYQSGSKAMFTGVTWHGDSSQIPIVNVSPDYYENVTHAFQTAPALASAVNGLKGGANKVIAAHSLGNMVVSAAIKDNSMNVAKYFLLDAAVAVEAFSSEELAYGQMLHPDWQNYNFRLWSTHWHLLFGSSDGRYKITWSNRFGNIGNAYNFYSSTEDVLNDADGSVPAIGTAERAWACQEMRKGSAAVGWITLDSHGGWGFNLAYDVQTSPGSPPDIPPTYRRLSPSDPQPTTAQLKAEPFFKRFQSQYNFLYQSTPVAADFYKDTSNSGGAKLLAEAIPALSLAVGRNEIETFGDRNRDLMGLRDGWPSGAGGRWHHSDAKDVAYRYNYPLWDAWVGSDYGNLK